MSQPESRLDHPLIDEARREMKASSVPDLKDLLHNPDVPSLEQHLEEIYLQCRAEMDQLLTQLQSNNDGTEEYRSGRSFLQRFLRAQHPFGEMELRFMTEEEEEIFGKIPVLENDLRAFVRKEIEGNELYSILMEILTYRDWFYRFVQMWDEEYGQRH